VFCFINCCFPLLGDPPYSTEPMPDMEYMRSAGRPKENDFLTFNYENYKGGIFT